MQQLNTFQDQCLRLSQERRTESRQRRSRVEVRKLDRVKLEGGRRIERDESAVTMATSVRGSTSRLSLNRSTRRLS
jgi:hypothetical protein